MASGILQYLVDATRIEITWMSIAKTCNHTVREEIFGRGLHSFRQDRTLLEEVDASLLIQHVGEITDTAQYRGTVAWRFIPSLALRIKAEVDELVHTPLANTILIYDIIQVVLLALAICVCLVILQYQGYLYDEVSLKQVPVVVRHTIGDDVLHPLLETSLDDGLVILHERFDEGIHLGEFVDDILVDNLEGSHSHQCLLMTVVQVDRHIAIGDTFHIDIEHLSCHLSVSHIAGSGIDASGISGNAHNLSVYAGDITTRLGRRGLLHFSCYLIDIGHIALLIVIVRHEVLQLWTIVLRLKTASSIIFHGGFRGTFSPHLRKGFTIYEDIRSVGVPEHLQSGIEPVGLRIYLLHHVFYLPLELGYLWAFRLFSAFGNTIRSISQEQASH